MSHRRCARTYPLALLLLLAPALAHAETALLLPPSGDAGLKPQQHDAQEVLVNALESQAIRIVNQADVAAQLGGSAKECKNIDCAQPLLQASGADVAAAVAIWGSGTPKVPTMVYVTLVDRRGERYPAKINVEGGDLAATIKQALLEARALQLLGPGPWLRVRAKPEGAEVMLDDKAIGTAPLRAPIQPGRHRLEVRFEGYRPHVQTVDIPPTDARQFDVDADLTQRTDNGVAPPEQPSTMAGVDARANDAASDTNGPPRSKRAIVGPLVLGGVGAVLVIYDVSAHLAAVAAGSCQHREPSGTCTQKKHVNVAPTIVYAAVGVGAIVGAVLWYVLSDNSPPDEARLHISPGLDSLTLTAHF